MSLQYQGLPRMSMANAQNMITFKDYFVKQNKELSKHQSQEQLSKQSPTSDQKTITQKLKIQKEMDEFQKSNKEITRRKILFEQKYNCFVDRIYGKINRERKDLDHIMHHYRKLSSQQDSQKKFMNHQEILIMEEIKGSEYKQKTDNVLLNRIDRDFRIEVSKDMDNLPNHHKLQLQSKKNCQQLIDKFYHSASEQSAFFSDPYTSFKQSKNDKSHIQTQSLQIQPLSNKSRTSVVDINKKSSQSLLKLLQTQPVSNQNKSPIFSKRSKYEINSPKRQNSQLYDQKETYSRICTNVSQNEKLQIQQQFYPKSPNEFKTHKKAASQTEVCNMKLILNNLSVACKKQYRSGRTILKFCKKEQKVFNSKYHKIQVSHSEFAK